MRLRFYALILFLLLPMMVTVYVQAGEALTLDRCITLALKNNHLFRSYHQELRAAQARSAANLRVGRNTSEIHRLVGELGGTGAPRNDTQPTVP